MAVEKSVNLNNKTIGGVIGITQRPGALAKWLLTAHERTATTTATEGMLDMGRESPMGDEIFASESSERRG